MNSGISEDLCSLKYASSDSALKLICHFRPGYQLVKMDMKDVYRIVLVHPDDHTCWVFHEMG